MKKIETFVTFIVNRDIIKLIHCGTETDAGGDQEISFGEIWEDLGLLEHSSAIVSWYRLVRPWQPSYDDINDRGLLEADVPLA